MAFSKQTYNKNNLIAALEKCMGIVTAACKMCKIHPDTYYEYLKKDPDFAKKIEQIQESVLDFAESSLYQQIKDHNTTATIFFLKTKGRKRGYIEKVDVGIEDTERRMKELFDKLDDVE